MKWAVFTLIFYLHACPLASGLHSRLYIWNVGQGQWITWQNHNTCIHLDVGGEYAPLKKISRLCRNKKNEIYLTHADTDHIRYLQWARQKLKIPCLQGTVRGHLSVKKKEQIQQMTKCRQPNKYVLEINTDGIRSRDTNTLSRVFILKGSSRMALIPGDSTAEAEYIWHNQVRFKNIQLLVLGHHGSRTSTSQTLLNSLPQLANTISSSRFRRYGHPHRTVIERIHQKQIPNLRTESWGNLVFEL